MAAAAALDATVARSRGIHVGGSQSYRRFRGIQVINVYIYMYVCICCQARGEERKDDANVS
jgi:hypothetical protein